MRLGDGRALGVWCRCMAFGLWHWDSVDNMGQERIISLNLSIRFSDYDSQQELYFRIRGDSSKCCASSQYEIRIAGLKKFQ